MKIFKLCLALAFVNACGSKSNFSGEGQQAPPQEYSGDAEPAPVITPVQAPKPPKKAECGSSVQKAGSFEIWTEPLCPKQFETYTVVIRVVLRPELVDGYDAISDLSGSVVGSDGFAKSFGPGTGSVTSFESSPDGGTFRFSLYAGAQIVNDTVQVTSRALLENQSVIINYSDLQQP